MAINEYADMLEKQASGSRGNEYEGFLRDDQGTQAQTIKQSMFVAQQKEPDRQAEVLKLSDKLKLPANIVERQYDTLSKQSNKASLDYEDMIKTTPGLAKWLEDPNNAAVGQDDIAGLRDVEKTVQEHSLLSTSYDALYTGISKLNSSIGKVPALLYDVAAIPQNLVADAIGREQIRSPDWLRNNAFVQAQDEAAKLRAPPELDQSIVKEIGDGNYGRAGRVLLSQFISNAPQQAALLVAALSGAGTAGLVAAGVTSAADVNDRSQETPGVTPLQATGNALIQGTAEAAFERVGTLGILKTWEGAIAKQYGKEVSRQVFKDFGKAMAYSVAAEGNEEGLTSVAQDLSDWITGVNPELNMGAIATRAIDAGIVGGFSGGAMTAPAGIASGAARLDSSKRSQMAKDFYLAFGKSAEAMKIRDRLPKAAKTYVDSVTQGTGVENVYIPKEAIETYYQSKNINPVKAMSDLGVLDKYTESQSTGADIEIPLSTFAEKIVGTEHFAGLQDDVKFNPSDMTVKESTAMKGELAKTAKEAESLASPEVDASPVSDDVKSQLTAAGYDEKTASTYASLYESTFKTLGERAGVNPVELFKQYGLKIGDGSAQGEAEQRFNQENKPAPTFYSKLQQTLEQKMGGSQDVTSLRAMLKDIKPEEMKWSGIDEFLAGKEKVSKGELLEHLRANQLEIEEVTKDESFQDRPPVDVLEKMGKSINGSGYWVKTPSGAIIGGSYTYEEAVAAAEAEWSPKSESDTKFSQYVLPGGENYREVLFRLPEESSVTKEQVSDSEKSTIEKKRAYEKASKESSEASQVLRKSIEKSSSLRKKSGIESGPFAHTVFRALDWLSLTPRSEWNDEKKARWEDVEEFFGKSKLLKQAETLLDLKLKTQALSKEYHYATRELDQLVEGKSKDSYHSSHFDEANVLAHTRLNDRVDADGRRVLFVEEIQSDWHQAGRKKGYKGDLKNQTPKEFFGIKDEVWNTLSEDEKQEYTSDMTAQLAKVVRDTGVPDAPFKKTWHEFVLKRLIREAAEKGYDRIAWTTGEQQAERYDLAKQVDQVDAFQQDDGNWEIGIIKDGRQIQTLRDVPQNKIEDYVGKDLTEKIIAKSGKEDAAGFHSYSGVDLKVGGEGMKGFYDKILVDAANKLGKKYGAKVGETTIEGGQDPEAIARENQRQQQANSFVSIPVADVTKVIAVHSLEITPELKAAALNEGFTLFQPTEDGGARGQISFGKDRQFRIDLLKDANLSTFLHETGHFYLEVLGDLATKEGAPAQLKDDFKTILDYLGAESREQIKVEHHEKLARSFEAYLMEGKAPTSELRRAFARLKIWLTNIYQRISALDVELTPEVRGVFDRLLATDQAITQAYGEQKIEPLFADPVLAGMTGEKAQRYIQARDDARQAAEDSVSQKLMDDYLKARSQEFQEERQKVYDRIESEVNQSRVYRAMSILQKGKMPDGSPLAEDLQGMKLSKEALVQQYGKEFLKRLPKPYIYSKDGGLHPDVAAEILGFESGDALVTQIANAVPKEQLINQQADAVMAENRPDLLTNGKLSDEAIQAVHNDKRAQMLRMELEHLASNNMPVLKDVIRKVARRVPTEKAVREQAVQILGSKTVGELKPYVYQRAEVKAANEAGKLLAKGDIDGAFEAKKRELLNHELYRAAVDAQEAIETSLEKFKMVARADEKLAKTRDIDLINAARAVLAEFGIGKTDQTAEQFLKQMKQYDPDTYESVNAIVESATQTVGPYKSVSYNDFIAMKDAVDALWDLSKSQREMEIDGIRVDREFIQDALEARLSDISKAGMRAGYDRAATTWDQTKMMLLGVKAAMRRVESWVDAVDGDLGEKVFRKYILNPIFDGTTQYRVEKPKYLQKYLDILKPIEKLLLKKEIRSDELGYTFSGKAELLGALLHTGNESNFSKLLRGRGWGSVQDDGSIDSSRWDKFIKRLQSDGTLTKIEYDVLQGIWDLHEELKPSAQKAHKEMYGYYFNEITANETVTPFGVFRGGYVPAVADPFISEDANIRNEKEGLEKVNNSFMFPTTGRGFTKSRVDQYAAPLTMDLTQVPMHIDKLLRFVHIEPKVKAVGRIIMHKGFRKNLADLDPTIGSDMLVPWLQRAAQQKVMAPMQGWGGKGADKFFRGLRARTGLQVMFANVSNALQQVTGLSIALVKVKPKHLRNGLWQYVRSPKVTADMIADKSDYMKTRITNQGMEIQQHIDDLILNPSKYDKVREFGTKHGYFIQSAAQNIVDVVTWAGAYDQAVAEGLSEKEAVRASDSAVRLTQGSMAPEDVSRFETGTAFTRMFTMFYSYFNMQSNLLGTEFGKTIRDLGLKKGAGRLLYVYTFGFATVAVMSELITKVMAGRLDEDDDDQYLDDLLALFFGSQFRTATAMIPLVGPTLNAGINRFNTKQYDDRISTSPAISMLESAVSSPKSVYDAVSNGGDKKRAVRDALSALGLLTGIPVAPLGRPLGYLSDVSTGDAQPTGPIDFTRGLVTGKTGEAKQ